MSAGPVSPLPLRVAGSAVGALEPGAVAAEAATGTPDAVDASAAALTPKVVTQPARTLAHGMASHTSEEATT
ncbi:hypothetical protein GCM10023215_50020 [Pseudonocardia yuanmonensis]|uniref:Uncharacterized protein n=1 Tax=Pseudonocardia yuanmonensis TaxID=1095914 RepID=A0ABP8XCY2_9PSEU